MNLFRRRDRKRSDGKRPMPQQTRMDRLTGEIKTLRERLKRMSDVKSNFVSVISHELRTPLTSIKEGVALLLEGALGEVNPKQKEFLEIVHRNTDRLSRLVNDLLDLSQLETGGVRFRKEAVAIHPLIQEIEAFVRFSFSEKKMRLRISTPERLPPAYIDSGRVKQVLEHLLENTLKFASKTGEVLLEISLCPAGDWGIWKDQRYLRISVKDQGAGIPKDKINKLFNKFEQINRKVGPGAQGTGLGLAICREIVERHGGRIWVESDQEQGAVFSFTLPVYEEDLELSVVFDESKLDAMLEHNPLLVVIFSLDGIILNGENRENRFESLRALIQNQIRTGDRMVYHRKEKSFYLFVNSERPAELSLVSRIQQLIREYLPQGAMVWSFYPEDGEDIQSLKAKAFQRAQAA